MGDRPALAMKMHSLSTFSRYKQNAAVVIVSILFLLATVFSVGLPDWSSLIEVTPLWLVAGLGAIALSVLCLTWRWLLFIRIFTTAPSTSQVFSIVSLISFATMLLPKELVEFFGRTLWLNRTFAVPLLSASSSVLADRLLDVVGLGIILCPAVCFFIFNTSLYMTAIILALCIFAGGVILFFTGSKSFAMLHACLWRASALLARLRKKKLDPSGFIMPSISRKNLLLAYVATLIKLLLASACYWAFARSLNMQVELLAFILAGPIVQIFFLISFTAGGAGFLEAGWYWTLTTLGIDAASISTYLVAQRLFFTVAVGIVALLAYLCRRVGTARMKEA